MRNATALATYFWRFVPWRAQLFLHVYRDRSLTRDVSWSFAGTSTAAPAARPTSGACRALNIDSLHKPKVPKSRRPMRV